jgi:hypothetical protein
MSFKKTLKSLVMTNPEWNGIIEYINKKGREVAHTIKKGKKI